MVNMEPLQFLGVAKLLSNLLYRKPLLYTSKIPVKGVRRAKGALACRGSKKS